MASHLVPGLGAHRIDKLEPEHIEKLYGRMIRSGLAAGSGHHAHRTLRVSLSEAVKRTHVALNVAMVVRPPRLADGTDLPLVLEVLAEGQSTIPSNSPAPRPVSAREAATWERMMATDNLTV